MDNIISISEYKKELERTNFEEIKRIFSAIAFKREAINKSTSYNCVFINKDGFIRFEKLMGFYERYRVPKNPRKPIMHKVEFDASSDFVGVDYYEFRFDHCSSTSDLKIFREM